MYDFSSLPVHWWETPLVPWYLGTWACLVPYHTCRDLSVCLSTQCAVMPLPVHWWETPLAPWYLGTWACLIPYHTCPGLSVCLSVHTMCSNAPTWALMRDASSSLIFGNLSLLGPLSHLPRSVCMSSSSLLMTDSCWDWLCLSMAKAYSFSHWYRISVSKKEVLKLYSALQIAKEGKAQLQSKFQLECKGWPKLTKCGRQCETDIINPKAGIALQSSKK